MDRSRIAIVIPALNESRSIERVVISVRGQGVPIVVDDGSIDETSLRAVKAGAVVVRHSENLGYDAALNSGFRKAAELGAEAIVTFDADGQHDASLLGNFVGQLEVGFDVVVGLRSRRQRLAEHLFAAYTGWRYGLHDPLCGLKAYRTAVYRTLGHFDSYGSIGTELALFAARSGCRLAEIRFNVREREGQSRFGSVLRGNWKILRALCIACMRRT